VCDELLLIAGLNNLPTHTRSAQKLLRNREGIEDYMVNVLKLKPVKPELGQASAEACSARPAIARAGRRTHG